MKLPITIQRPEGNLVIKTEEEWFLHVFHERKKINLRLRTGDTIMSHFIDDRFDFDSNDPNYIDTIPTQKQRHDCLESTWGYRFLQSFRTYLHSIGCNKIHGYLIPSNEINLHVFFCYQYQYYTIQIREYQYSVRNRRNHRNRNENMALDIDIRYEHRYQIILTGFTQPICRYEWSNTMPDLTIFLPQLQAFFSSITTLKNKENYEIMGLIRHIEFK